MKLEHELVLSLVNFRNPNYTRINELLKEKLDWAEVLGHLVYNRVAGIAYTVLKNCGLSDDDVNREFKFGLYMSYELQRIRSITMKKTLIEMQNELEKSDVKFAFLKGSVLTYAHYPTGCRSSNDIDLLVNPEDVTKIGNNLKNLGFVQGSYDRQTNSIIPASRREILHCRVNFGEIMSYLRVSDDPGANFIMVDVNFSIDSFATGREDVVKDFLNNVQKYKTVGNNVGINSLNPEYFLIYLCAHLYKESAMSSWVERQRDLSLYKFADIYAYLTEENTLLNWDLLYKICTSNSLEKEAYYALGHTLTFFPDLKANHGIKNFLEKIKPENTEFLNHFYSTDQRFTTYEWRDDLITRFFDMKRLERTKLAENNKSKIEV